MEKRWYKISELVESLEFTKVEIIKACLDGKIPAYTPDGMQLFRVNIPLEEIPYQFLMEHRLTRSSKPFENELCRETLYSSYEDLKDCLISDDGKEAYLMGLPSIVEARTFRTPYFRELAERKLQADAGGMSNDATPASASLQADESTCNARSKTTLFKLIMGLVDLYHIDLAEPGLATSLENATDAKGCKLPRSTANGLLREISEFEKKIAN